MPKCLETPALLEKPSADRKPAQQAKGWLEPFWYVGFIFAESSFVFAFKLWGEDSKVLCLV